MFSAVNKQPNLEEQIASEKTTINQSLQGVKYLGFHFSLLKV